MKVTKGTDRRLPQFTAVIELEPAEAAKLVDLMGEDILIPLKAFDGKHAKTVKAFMWELFDKLNDIGFRRSQADWSK